MARKTILCDPKNSNNGGNVTNIHPWPMNLLTKDSGENRKLVVKPVDICSRSNIRPDAKGMLRFQDIDKLKLYNTIVYPEVKEQGHFTLYCRDSEGHYKVYGRKQNVNGYYIDIRDKLCRCNFTQCTIPCGTVIAGELVWPGHPDSKVPTAIKECPEELDFKAFGVPIYKDVALFGEKSITYPRGRRLLESVLPPEFWIKSLDPVQLGDKEQTAEALEYFLQLAKKQNWEGLVFKQKAYDGWWKLKGIREADVFVTDFKVSESETQKGLVTAVSIAVFNENGKEVDMGSVTGFSLQEKELMTIEYKAFGTDADNNRYMRRPLRVCYQEIAGRGKLKHAFFDGWRDDKSYTECSSEQFS